MKALLIIALIATVYGQQNRDLQYQRYPDKRGINMFETLKKNDVQFNGLNLVVGASSTLQYQALDHENGTASYPLVELGHNFNLATADLHLDAQLANGLRMHLTTYLSSRHHTETYVKGGYFQIDRLDFIDEGTLSDLMDHVTIKIGHMEINYGDNHFRRSDNASTLYNPFVGNLILDAFNTEVAGEIYYKSEPFMFMFGLSNSKLNQDVKSKDANDIGILAKAAFDKQINDDMRVRIAASLYTNSKMKSVYLYSGDRTGARYYSVLDTVGQADDFRSGRWNPAFVEKLTAMVFNGFVKYQGLEFFGTFETAEGGDAKVGGVWNGKTRTWNQLAAEVLYRFGMNENYYLGFRYNTASGKQKEADANEIKINRMQFGLGWFMTDNVLAKFEYVNQDYKDFPVTDAKYYEANFSGYMLEASIMF
ncbi:MAG: hypothetical protein KDD94_07680 [Calditrichaeota bacterium]|nr:hypothetical protein [Calditrichota bacterium]